MNTWKITLTDPSSGHSVFEKFVGDEFLQAAEAAEALIMGKFQHWEIDSISLQGSRVPPRSKGDPAPAKSAMGASVYLLRHFTATGLRQCSWGESAVMGFSAEDARERFLRRHEHIDCVVTIGIYDIVLFQKVDQE